LDPRIPDGLTEIRANWSLTDVVHAHQFLDQLDVMAARQRAEAERARGKHV